MAKLYKKDFKLIADVIREIPIKSEAQAACATIIKVAYKFNPAFDRDKFKEACGL